MKISTKVFTKLVNKAYKCSTNTKEIPLTTLMCIKIYEGQLRIITSNDDGDYLYVISNDISEDDVTSDFYVTVYAEPFVKLINKITSDTVTLSVNDGVLKVIGNGIYKLELPFDENGGIIQYPDPIRDKFHTGFESGKINLDLVKQVNLINKPSLAKTDDLDEVQYNNYYVGDKVVSTDRYKLCSNDVKLFTFDSPALLSSGFMDLIEVMGDGECDAYKYDNELIFIADDCMVYGYIEDGIENYDIDAINSLCNIVTDSVCKFYKSSLLETLDRLNLFVGTYDKNVIKLEFNAVGVKVSSLQTNATEVLECVHSETNGDYECMININVLMEQIKASDTEIITIEYGNDKVIKLVSDDVIQVIALKLKQD